MKKILILGAGRSGKAASMLLKGEGRITLWDVKSEESFAAEDIELLRKNGIDCIFGKEPGAFGWDLVVLSPGIPIDHPLVERLRNAGAEISGELEQAYEHCRGKFIGITGTNGKTTVSSLIFEMLKAAELPSVLAGNIGTPLAACIGGASEETLMVTEVSSFQLETAKDFRPAVSVILNISPDHLDRHKSFENYIALKAKICRHQGLEDFFVYNYEDGNCRKIAETCKAVPFPFSAEAGLERGVSLRDGKLVIKDGKRCIELCAAEELIIPGRHNLENALAASAAAYLSGASPEAIAAVLRSFEGVAHRMEFVREYRGARYINDSKATNPDSAIKAIEATSGSIILIAGGYEKGSDFGTLIKSFGGRVKYLLLIGQTAERFAAAAEKSGFPASCIHICRNMLESVQKASLLAGEGDSVLLSPASASWDMYSDFEERGEHFKALVRELDG